MTGNEATKIAGAITNNEYYPDLGEKPIKNSFPS